MSSDWTDCLVGDVVNLKRGYDLPKQLRRTGKIPIVSSSGTSDYHDTAMAKGPGVVTGRYGTIGNVYYVEEDFFPLNTTLYVQNFKGNDKRFVSYFLETIDFLSCSDKAAVPGVNRNHLHLLKASVPPLQQQKAIAKILGTLDDKIKLSRKTNETLEGIAKALFKSWFVDFDPVRAKAEGRPTGLPNEISELFPDSFEQSALGEIPNGWHVMNWGELVRLEYGKTLKGYKDSKQSIPVYGTNGIAGHTGRPLVDAEGIIVGRKGAYRGIHYSDEPFYVIDTAFYVSSKTDEHLFSRWCFYSMKSIDMASIDSGSAIPSTSREDFYAIEFICPPRLIQELFEKLLAPIWKRQKLLGEESMILESLRNSLLPRLISGELRVPDAERILEEVGT